MDFFQILVVASHGPYSEAMFYLFFFYYFLQIFFVFINMGPYGSENFKTLLLLQIAAEIQLYLNFLPNGPHKSMFGIFEILSFRF